MADRRIVGGGTMPPPSWRRVMLVALTLIIMAGPVARAAAQARALDHQATVLNGRVVGSAFAIGADLALTNAHVVAGLRPGSAVHLTTEGPGGVAVSARLLAVSNRMDLALLRLPRGFLPAVPRADAPRRPGLAVRAAGVDASAGLGPRMELGGTIVSPRADLPAFGPGLVARVPGVRPGFSGGPLIDREGRLVGMITAIRPGRTAMSDGAAAASGFAPRTARRPVQAEEAFVLRAEAIRAEARRLLAQAGH
jgi:S1-C subfamily serine protease